MIRKETPNWQKIFTSIQKINAPFPLPYVTEMSADYANDPSKRAFLVLISTVISLRTKDKVTKEASERLFQIADNAKNLSGLSEKQIAEAIYPCGFYNTKAKQILQITKILMEKYDGKVPNDIDELVSLPGVGRKTANLVLTEGYDTDGICVDTHVHRILNRLDVIKTKSPDDTEVVLRKILPKKYWKKINLWLVTFGQNFCKPVGPRCGECSLKKECKFGRESPHPTLPPRGEGGRRPGEGYSL